MNPKHVTLIIVVALVILFLMSFGFCSDCGIFAKGNLRFADTFTTCYECREKRAEKVRQAKEKEREKEVNIMRTTFRMSDIYQVIEYCERKHKFGEVPDTMEENILVWENGRKIDGQDFLGQPSLDRKIFNTRDAWGKQIQYKKLSKTSYEVRSAGFDRILGTADDITQTRTLEVKR